MSLYFSISKWILLANISMDLQVDTTSQSATGSKDIPAETTSLTHASERSNEIRQSWHESNNEAAVRLKSAVLSLPATVDSAVQNYYSSDICTYSI